MDQKKERPTIVNNITINAPIGRYFQYIENYNEAADDSTDDEIHVPTIEELKRAILRTKRDGLWWSNRSWGVSFRIYQITGYKGSYSDYVSLVNGASIETGFECNYDAIQKMASSAKLSGRPNTWEANGAPKQVAKLGMALLELLSQQSADEKELMSG